MGDFLKALRSGKVLVMDGAMGTELQRLSQPRRFRMRMSEAQLCALQILRAMRVRRVHSAYTAAGAEIVLTNTFQALGREDWQIATWCAEGADPAPRFSLGDIGPVVNPTRTLASALFARCARLDGVLLETWSSISALKIFAKGCPRRLPLLTSFTFLHGRGGEILTFEGESPEACAKAAKKCGAVALGANCGKEIDMDNMLEVVRRYRSVCDLPIFARPNAGTPKRTRSGWKYPRTPAAMAARLPALLEAGVMMIGGCCGTTPEHIRAFREVVDHWNGRGIRCS
jgi:5-methyltetrahydrofolate--homocysteine methyltransferase